MSVRSESILRGPDGFLPPPTEDFLAEVVEHRAREIFLAGVDVLQEFALLDLPNARNATTEKYAKLKHAISEGIIAVSVSTAAAEQRPLLRYPTRLPQIEFGFLDTGEGELHGLQPALIVHDASVIPNLAAEFPDGFSAKDIDELSSDRQRQVLLPLMMAHNYLATMEMLDTPEKVKSIESLLWNSDNFYFGRLGDMYQNFAKRLGWDTIPEGILPEEVEGVGNFGLQEFMHYVNEYLKSGGIVQRGLIDKFQKLSETTNIKGLDMNAVLGCIKAFIILRTRFATDIVEEDKKQAYSGISKDGVGERFLITLLTKVA